MRIIIKKILISTGIVVGIIVIILTLLYLLLYNWDWFYSYEPSPGIWQYSDDDLTITVYVSRNDEITSHMSIDWPPSWQETFTKRKAVILYNNGEKHKAVIGWHGKMYHCYIALVDEYPDVKSNVNLNYIYNSSYTVPMKKGEWEFGDTYNGKTLIFKKIGKYKEPQD